MSGIDLILVGDGDVPAWRLGGVERCAATPSELAAVLHRHAQASAPASAVLLWDPALGAPDASVVEHLAARVPEVFHAGLSLGQASRPRSLDFIEPMWMWNCNASPAIESTSWRMSFRACLIRTTVLQQMRGVYPRFHSLDAAALELGLHWIRRGVFMRHTPLLAPRASEAGAPLDAHDELAIATRSYPRTWSTWSALRGALTRAWSPADALRFAQAAEHVTDDAQTTFRRTPRPARRRGNERVTVLVPTIERYPYVETLLAQLRDQTVRPHEIIVIDQTPAADRDAQLATRFSDLPLRWLTLDRAGQCSSRNAGLLEATGDHILFIDDDDEVKPTLLQLHLEALARYDSDSSSGIAHEDGIPRLPEHFLFTRASDVFPTNNTMVRTDVLRRSGLFDLAYDRQQRADADLGMRVYLAGAFMVLNPEIDVLHHHAPRGGLRKHGARVVTYASSRSRIWERHVPSPSEFYLCERYFGEERARESMWQRALGTLSGHGSRTQRLAKLSAGLLMMPDTIRKIMEVRESARIMLRERAEIPTLPTP